VGHVDHGTLDAVLQLLELGTQLPFEMGIDDGEWFIEHDDVDVGADKTAA
jgi:hypothetical protein